MPDAKPARGLDLGLGGRAAIVTGASKGIGRAVAEVLAEQGARVCIVSRDAKSLGDASIAIEATGGEVMTTVGDVRDEALATQVVGKVFERWGRVDVLVNNAGGPPFGSFLDHDQKAWRDAIDLSFLSAVRFSTAAAPYMKKARWGRIVNISSSLAKEPTSPMVLSASARAALSAFTRAVSQELGEYNVTINTVLPGGVKTARFNDLLKARADRDGIEVEALLKVREANVPIRRFAEPREIGELVAFLASDRGGNITGSSISADGGLTKGTF